MSLVNDNITECSTIAFLMEAGSSKIHVAWNIVAWLNSQRGKNVLCTASLMSRNYIFKAKQFTNGLFQVIEVAGSAVSFVTYIRQPTDDHSLHWFRNQLKGR